MADLVVPLAVVGLGVKGPGDADNTENFLSLVAEAREAWSEIPPERWNRDAFYHPDRARKGATNVKSGHFIKRDLSRFDAGFFNITSEEASSLDPQQRMLLECCYETLENAGIPLQKAVGSNTAVFVGTFASDYSELLYKDPLTMPIYQATGASSSRAMLSNRLSHFFDFRGPSVTCETACSASMTALHLACQALRTGEAESAVVAGSSVMLHPELYMSMSAMGFLSPDGRCYSFDHRANGYSRGEGIVSLLLKPLANALRDGDPIRAVIRNTGVNQDGKTVGITNPSLDAQESLIRRVYAEAGLDPVETQYVEAHGTGTQAGDPVETKALSRAFCTDRQADNPLVIGSVKSNIGHTEGASGLFGVLKSVLMLEGDYILPSRNFEKPNVSIDLEGWKLSVATEPRRWHTSGPRRVSVNSFGYGGTNGHAILESAHSYLSGRSLNGVQGRTNWPIQQAPAGGISSSLETASKWRTFVLSAQDAEGGSRQAVALKKYLETRPAFQDNDLADLAFTLNHKRTHFPWKTAVQASSVEGLLRELDDPDLKLSKPSAVPRLGFVFTGQGAQWARMGMGLKEVYPRYQQSLDQMNAHLKSLGCEWDLIEELELPKEQSRLSEAGLSQPICSALQIALVDLLGSFGIHCKAVTGHSSGEIAAAYAAGALTLEDAMTIAYFRGVSAEKLHEADIDGSMMAVGMSKDDILPILRELQKGVAVVACVNSPSNITVSGDTAAVDELKAILDERKTFARKLAVQVAYHSPHVATVKDFYSASIPDITLGAQGEVKFFSSVTGRLADLSELGREYWVSNLLGEVKFATSLAALAKDDVDLLLEIGPHSALAGPIRQIVQADSELKARPPAYLTALVRFEDQQKNIVEMAGKLCTAGYPVDLQPVNQQESQRVLQVLSDLPPYAWNHEKSYWAESRLSKEYRSRARPRSDLLGVLDINSNTRQPRWRNVVRLTEQPWLRDHKIQGSVVYPGAGYLVMAVEAMVEQAATRDELSKVQGVRLREVSISQALVVPEETGQVEVFLTLRPHTESVRSPSDIWQEFTVSSVSPEGAWVEHCCGLVALQKHNDASSNDVRPEVWTDSLAQSRIHSIQAACTRSLQGPKFYNTIRALGLDYGPTFANLSRASVAAHQCVAHLVIPNTANTMPFEFEHPFLVHPSLLDSIFHPVFAAVSTATDGIQDPAVPVFIREMLISRQMQHVPGNEIQVYAQTALPDARKISSSLTVVDKNVAGPVISIEGLELTKLARDTMEDQSTTEKTMAYQMEWKADVDLLNSATAGARLDPAKAWPDMLGQYLLLLGHKNPQMKILDSLPAGTAVCAAAVQCLRSSSGDSLYHSYDVAGLQEACSEGVRELLDDMKDSVSVLQQSICGSDAPQPPTEKYDAIIIDERVTSSHETLRRLRELLSDTGRLISVTVYQESKDERRDSGFVDEHMQAVGLELDVAVAGHEQAAIKALTVHKTASLTVDVTERNTELLLISDIGQDDLVSQIRKSASTMGITVSTSCIGGANVEGKHCVVLNGLVRPHFRSDAAKPERAFEFARRLFLKSAGALWVTSSATNSSPEHAIFTGMARTARSELGGTPLITLDVDGKAPNGDGDLATLIMALINHRLLSTEDPVKREQEYVARGGQLLVPRLVKDAVAHEAIGTTLAPKTCQKLPWLQSDRTIRLEVGSPGLLDSLHFADDPTFSQQLPNDFVQIESRACGINFRDVMLAMGQITAEPLGAECSGVVTAVGKDVQNVTVGDRVAGFQIGLFSSRAQMKASGVQKIPDSMSFATAAALPVVYCTAYHAVYNVARVMPGESVLVHAASGGLGQALIELCQHVGAIVYVTVGTKDKKEHLMTSFNIPEDRIFWSREGVFAEGIMRQTSGKGVDVIMNSLAGEGLRLSWSCIAAFGRFIELGKRDFFVNTRLEMAKFAKNVTFAAVDLVGLAADRPAISEKVWADVMDLIRRGEARPPSPIVECPMSDVPRALRMMQSGKHMGKLVATTQPDELVEVMPPSMDEPLCEANASYVLVGGLGGLGRAIAAWMATRGARNLIIISRSGAARDEAQQTINLLQDRGLTVKVVACDVGDYAQLKKELEELKTDMPPIRGVIQGAMSLQDVMLENMTMTDFTDCLRPKVAGTWNLHHLLPRDMDFFIMLSSISGVIGNASQANYSGANAFLDEFARFRQQQGLVATSIDLGVIQDIGYVSENAALAQAMKRQGFETTTERELMALLEYSIKNPSLPLERRQMVTGLGRWSSTALGNFDSPVFAHFRKAAAVTEGGGAATVKDSIARAKTPQAAAEIICAALAQKVSALCMLAESDIATSKTLSAHGIDSLVAVELRNWMFKELEHTMPILELLGNASLVQISEKIANTSRLVGR